MIESEAENLLVENAVDLKAKKEDIHVPVENKNSAVEETKAVAAAEEAAAGVEDNYI